MPKSTYLYEKTNKKRHELYLMIVMWSYYEGVRKCLINLKNVITKNITIITWMFGVDGTSSKGSTL